MKTANSTQSSGSFLSVPIVNRRPWGQISLALNIFPLPGLGNIVAGIKSGHLPTTIWGILFAAGNITSVSLNYVSPATWAVIAVFAFWGLSTIWGIRIFRASR